MMTMVCFEAAGAAYCIPVGATRAVRLSSGMITLPSPGPAIVGIIPGDPPLTVIAPLGAGGAHVLIVEASGKRFGLLVDAVTGLRRIADGDIHPSPEGQAEQLVSGTINHGDRLVLVTDPTALAGQL